MGAGSGDDDLITKKGINCIKKADDSNNAELIYVGKKPNNHTLSQEEIYWSFKIMVTRKVRYHGIN
ncbi:hypothetical protein [Natranaerobius trueperi]|uniref:Uncharacterized protein n=1 Tax=Natranaerobius trueperi TaxID=759412 RepID=A0A226BV15_9FIRM|nr:hypothetical protein [Natranaerobius trueperi]OWZ82878.1 hypothetical protein CDO51_11625 [Natranaerobius trueperi]